MPVLARLVEKAGLPTAIVTMMPAVAEHLLAPRIVGVPFPFGHPFGVPNDVDMQWRVLMTSLTVLAGATQPGARIDLDLEWPVPVKEAYKAWQPAEASPIVAVFLNAARREES